MFEPQKIEEAIELLDDGCLAIMNHFANVPHFEKLSADQMREAYKGQVSPAFIELMISIPQVHPEGNRVLAGREHSIRRMLDLGITRCVVSQDGSKCAYHWTAFGIRVLTTLGLR
jgi:hypothetical protein